MSLRERLAPQVGLQAANEAADASCVSCGAQGMVAFYEVAHVPAQTCVLLDSAAEAADVATASVLLAFCERCGLIQNTRFEPDLIDYSLPTEESQAFSPRFNAFADALADDLFGRYALDGKSVFEIGCGKGDFLMLLADRGIGPSLGIDPGFVANRDFENATVEFRREIFNGDYPAVASDLIVTRHLMEHVPNVGEFFSWQTDLLRLNPDAALFTEVPDTARVLSEGAFWDVYHEHCSYFTPGSLARALRHSGLGMARLELGYEDQYILSEAHLGPDEVFEIEESARELADSVAQFSRVARRARDHWRDVFKRESQDGRAVVWGGGSKAAGFLGALDGVEATVVDINPHKQGKWLPGTKIEILPPEALIELKPSLVVAMNPIYEAEIASDLRAMDLEPRLICV